MMHDTVNTNWWFVKMYLLFLFLLMELFIVKLSRLKVTKEFSNYVAYKVCKITLLATFCLLVYCQINSFVNNSLCRNLASPVRNARFMKWQMHFSHILVKVEVSLVSDYFALCYKFIKNHLGYLPIGNIVSCIY